MPTAYSLAPVVKKRTPKERRTAKKKRKQRKVSRRINRG